MCGITTVSYELVKDKRIKNKQTNKQTKKKHRMKPIDAVM